MTKVLAGMTVRQAREILGAPDEATPLYEPKVMSGHRIGTSYWYLIERKSRVGSVDERGEKLVVLRADLSDRISEVQHWGL